MTLSLPIARGRPRTFDRDQALRSAMDLFMAKGYDGASLEDLLRVMGKISPPSFYAAFGSKDQLFKEVVALYRQTYGESVMRAVNLPAVRDAIEGMMRAGVELFVSNKTAPGCLFILGAVHETRTGKEAHDILSAARSEGCEVMRKRLVRAVDEGELPKGLPINDIAGFYATFMQGLAVRARDGAKRSEMLAWIDAAMAAWPALTKGPKTTKKRSR